MLAKPLVVRVEIERVALAEKAAEALLGKLVPGSASSAVAVIGDTGGLGRPLERPLGVRSRLSLVLGLRMELGTTKAGSALRAAANAGLDGAGDGFAGPKIERLLLVEAVLLRLERPAVLRPEALVLKTLALAGDCDMYASVPAARPPEVV